MARAQKPDFFFRRNGRVHLNRRGRQFSLLAAEVCASAVVVLDTPCSEVLWRVLATHSIRQFPLHFPSPASPCAITFQLDSTYYLSTYLAGKSLFFGWKRAENKFKYVLHVWQVISQGWISATVSHSREQLMTVWWNSVDECRKRISEEKRNVATGHSLLLKCLLSAPKMRWREHYATTTIANTVVRTWNRKHVIEKKSSPSWLNLSGNAAICSKLCTPSYSYEFQQSRPTHVIDKASQAHL
jgi:hypothetical protein